MMFLRRKKASIEQTESALRRGVSRLASMQQPAGSFPVYRRDGNGPWQPCHALFSTLTVLLAAGPMLPEAVRARAVDFVLAARRDDGTWVFGHDLGIPADSDDTACALAVLARFSPDPVRDTDASLLRSFWRRDGGPFRTWNAEGKWADRKRDDAVVNCNVVLGLKEVGSPASAGEIDAVAALIRDSETGCRYYCSPMTITYAASRAGLPMHRLPPALLRRPGIKKFVLPTAQWLAAARRWDDTAVSHLLAGQDRTGQWDTEPWFTGAGRPPPVWGSPAISTALCLEALYGAINADEPGAGPP